MGFFKAYDMRGTFGSDFDLDTVLRVGRALPSVVTPGSRPRWLVGRDCRTTSDAVHDALVTGLSEAGAEVSDLGRCTTPMVYFFTAADGYDGSVMVTASHNPPSDNGLKVSRTTALPVGYADGLDKVERMVAASAGDDGRSGVRRPAAVTEPDDGRMLARYIAWQREHGGAPDGVKYAVDCSSGMASLVAHELFPGAVFVNDTPDGTFPAHSPNPLKAEAREQIARVVREKGLDCGVIFDGDADRAMFVDERGDFVQPDYLIPVVARATRRFCGVSSAVAPRIIHDVRTSRGAIEALRESGFDPVMVPVGHSFAKPALRLHGALCGGELAGHYYFSEFFGCDSGVLAALRVLSEVALAKARCETFSEMMRPIVSRYANSGEMNFKVEDPLSQKLRRTGKDAKDLAIDRVLAVAKTLGKETSRSEIDGVRIEYEDGWINVRKSNTEPYLRLVVECRGADMLEKWTDALASAIGEERQ